MLILTHFDNGDSVGIPLQKSNIKKLENLGAIEFGYFGMVDIKSAVLIPRVGLPDLFSLNGCDS